MLVLPSFHFSLFSIFITFSSVLFFLISLLLSYFPLFIKPRAACTLFSFIPSFSFFYIFLHLQTQSCSFLFFPVLIFLHSLFLLYIILLPWSRACNKKLDDKWKRERHMEGKTLCSTRWRRGTHVLILQEATHVGWTARQTAGLGGFKSNYLNRYLDRYKTIRKYWFKKMEYTVLKII